jgi:hypothetical protein
LILVFVSAWGCALPAWAQKNRRLAPAASARQTVDSFFRFHFAHGMDFTERNLRQRRHWLTPELYDLLREEFRKEAKRAGAHPDEAPFIEGDPFTNSQEYPKSFSVGQAIASGGFSIVKIELFWAGRTPGEREHRTASVTLSLSGARWLISNIKSADGEDLLVLLRKPRE